ncbi:MAG: protein-methionine-sulfoxide reductase catalytic subunit MsrP [Pseudomonadota bacterium]
MLIRQRSAHHVTENEVTPQEMYLNRRSFIAGAVAAGLLPASPAFAAKDAAEKKRLEAVPWPRSTDEIQTPYEQATSYNNYYEFGTDKRDPAKNAGSLITEPWSVNITGAVAKPGRYWVEDLISPQTLEERIYRLRCVEAWSMVIPWVGFPLSKLMAMVEPTSKAKYVAFKTLYDRSQMPGTRFRVLDWPYREGLRMDEAANPLTLMAVGMYGEELPNQNGAPLRLVVPWKYGFKSIKSIVEIAFVEEQPKTSWNMSAPQEYGFYSNVNPAVSHPRWSQASERRLDGRGFFASLKRIETLPFNGYADDVASMYSGMDLSAFY